MKKHKPKMPKNLKLKFGSEMEAMWTNVKRNSETRIKTLSDELVVANAMKELSEQKIREEQDSKEKDVF